MREPQSKEELKRIISEEWAKIDDDKELCRRFMQSIPKRLQVNMEINIFCPVIGQFVSILQSDWSNLTTHVSQGVINVGGRQIRKTDY